MSDKLYYAKGLEVWKAPRETKVEGGTSISVGFPVCTVSDYVGEEGASSVAELLHLGETGQTSPTQAGDDPFECLARKIETSERLVGGGQWCDGYEPLENREHFAGMVREFSAALGAPAAGSSPAPVQHVTLVDINAVIALVKDCGEDAQPESEYCLACNDLVEALSEFAPAPVQHLVGGQHPDDLAVDRFAAAMKAKLAKRRDEGRGGWEDKEDCSQLFLSQLLREHVEKGDPVDVGNFAMMLHQREGRIASLLEILQGE